MRRGKLRKKALQCRDSTGKRLRPAEAAALASECQMRLKGEIAVIAACSQRRKRLGDLAVAFPRRCHLAGRQLRVLDVHVGNVRLKQRESLSMRPHAHWTKFAGSHTARSHGELIEARMSWHRSGISP